MKWLLTCEHGGNKIPNEYSHLFEGNDAVLNSHRGWDIGVPEVYQAFKKLKPDYSSFADVSRLLVELNRTVGKTNHFSEFTNNLPKGEKERIIKNHYFPFRDRVKEFVEVGVEKSQLLHLSVHTFTPSLNGIERNADISFLYDPRNTAEKDFCRNWKRNLALFLPDLNVRFNYPYKGIADGHTTWLRKRFGNYAGIELEVNQKYFEEPHTRKNEIIEGLIISFSNILAQNK